MKRFYFGSEDEGDEDDSEAFEMPSPSELIAMTQMDSPFRHLMDSAVRICEKTFMWSFMPPVDKMKMIKAVFAELSLMEKEYEKDANIRDDM